MAEHDPEVGLFIDLHLMNYCKGEVMSGVVGIWIVVFDIDSEVSVTCLNFIVHFFRSQYA